MRATPQTLSDFDSNEIPSSTRIKRPKLLDLKPKEGERGIKKIILYWMATKLR